MLAVLAAFVFVIAGVLGWVGAISLAHLIAVVCGGLALLSVHLAFRVFAPAGRTRYW